MLIRPANLPDEYPTLNALFNSHWDDFPNSQEYPLIPNGMKTPQVLCAEHSNQIVGLALWLHMQSEGLPILHLQKLVVHSDFRRRGIASDLLLSVTKLADSENAAAELRVDRNNTGLISLYEDFGFSICEGEKETPSKFIYMERPALTSTL